MEEPKKRPDPAQRKANKSIHVVATPARAMAAFFAPEQLAAWWGVTRALVEERKGGIYALRWEVEGHLKFVTTGVVKSIKPGERIRIEPLVVFGDEFPIMGPMRLFISVKAEADGARVSVRQDGFGAGPEWDRYYDVVLQGWKDTLKLLKSWLEATPGTAAPTPPA